VEERGWAYRRRQPEGTVLYEAVRDNLATLLVDVFACPRCGGRRKVLAYVTAPAGVRSILEHLGLPTQALKRAPARGPPQRAWC
jgi:hypothetical protein